MNFCRRLAGHSLRDKVRSSDIWERLWVEPLLLLHNKSSKLRWFGHAHLGGDPGAEQGHTGEIISLGWLGNVLVSPLRSFWNRPGGGTCGCPYSNCCPGISNRTRIETKHKRNILNLCAQIHAVDFEGFNKHFKPLRINTYQHKKHIYIFTCKIYLRS